MMIHKNKTDFVFCIFRLLYSMHYQRCKELKINLTHEKYSGPKKVYSWFIVLLIA